MFTTPTMYLTWLMDQCIDVTRELESCGGCMSGQFYAANATVGEK